VSESKVPPQTLSPEEARLLVYAACCVIAADGTIAQKERDALLATMNRIGIPHDPKAMNAHIVAVCKQIYKEGVTACAAKAARQVAGASSSLKAALSSLTAELPWADGKATLEEIDFFGTVLTPPWSASNDSVVAGKEAFEPRSHADKATFSASRVGEHTRAAPAALLVRRDEWLWWCVAGVPLVGGALVGLLSDFDYRPAATRVANHRQQQLPAVVEAESDEQSMLADMRKKIASLEEQLSKQGDDTKHADQTNDLKQAAKALQDELTQANTKAALAAEEAARSKAALEEQKSKGSRAVPQASPAEAMPAENNKASGLAGMSRKDFLERIRLSNGIRRGMTKEEVRDIVGMPQEWPLDLSGLGLCAMWSHKTNNPATQSVDEMVLISFGENGQNAEKVVFVESREVFRNSVTASGTTTDSAFRLLGPPDEIDDESFGDGPLRAWTYRYRVAASEYPGPVMVPREAKLYFDERDRLKFVLTREYNYFRSD
jgi:hypothetical protein